VLQVWTVLNNCAGINKPLVVAKEAFEVLVRKSLRQLHNPGMQCLELVTKELLRITEECMLVEITRCGVHTAAGGACLGALVR
jgi:Dynamin central region